MKIVLLLCALCVLGATAVFMVQQREPTRVRVPEGVARALDLPAEAEIDPSPYVAEPRIALQDPLPQPDWIEEPAAEQEPKSREPLTDELAAVLRERGLEVQVPAMVLYSGFQLNEALRCFEDGMQQLVSRYSAAEPIDVGIARMRARGDDEVTIESDVSSWLLGSTACLTVASNMGRIAQDLREGAEGGVAGRERVGLRAKIRAGTAEKALTSAFTFAEGDPHFAIQFQKREWHFVLTIPWSFLESSERASLEAALERRDRAVAAMLEKRGLASESGSEASRRDR